METYVTMGKGVGMGSVDDVRAAIGKLNCTLLASYLIFGEYDYMMTIEAPDAVTASMAVFMAKRAMQVEGESVTMRAFTEADMSKMGEIAQELGLMPDGDGE